LNFSLQLTAAAAVDEMANEIEFTGCEIEFTFGTLMLSPTLFNQCVYTAGLLFSSIGKFVSSQQQQQQQQRGASEIVGDNKMHIQRMQGNEWKVHKSQ